MHTRRPIVWCPAILAALVTALPAASAPLRFCDDGVAVVNAGNSLTKVSCCGCCDMAAEGKTCCCSASHSRRPAPTKRTCHCEPGEPAPALPLPPKGCLDSLLRDGVSAVWPAIAVNVPALSAGAIRDAAVSFELHSKGPPLWVLFCSYLN